MKEFFFSLSFRINAFHLLDNCNGDVIVKVMNSRVKLKVLRDVKTTKSLFNEVPVVAQPYVEAFLLFPAYCKLQMLHLMM